MAMCAAAAVSSAAGNKDATSQLLLDLLTLAGEDRVAIICL
jgi:hypothetical protein